MKSYSGVGHVAVLLTNVLKEEPNIKLTPIRGRILVSSMSSLVFFAVEFVVEEERDRLEPVTSSAVTSSTIKAK